jgi:response regulator RpfG family c-di-GMP phosphodiesterase
MSDSDVLSFADEVQTAAEPWHVLIVDDEPGVHDVTRLVLGNFRFEDRPLQFHHAYSGAQARELLGSREDLAVVLLDVVMESEHTGLELVRYIREVLKNVFIRIVLRTGQPGQAPEHEVIANYDINDYKDKTELTAQKLATTLYATLRAYRDVMIIDANKRGLERVIHASAHIFSQSKRTEFASAVLQQLTGLVGVERGALYCKLRPTVAPIPDHFVVAAATGDYERYIAHNADERLPLHIVQSLKDAWERRTNVFQRDHYVLYFTDSKLSESLLYVGETWRLSDLDYRLVELFCTNVSIAFENLHLNQELFDSQLEMVHLLAGAAETRSKETANHVKRVGLLAEMLALAHGQTRAEANLIKFAAPLHDIGKIGIPDAILNKPGAHTVDESEIMRTHAKLGAILLAGSKWPLLKLASTAALEHHENWDGSGYPSGLRETEISLVGRITAIADVFDALGSKRCYKPAWTEPDMRAFILSQRGRKFDPQLVDLLINDWDRAMRMREAFPD